MRIPKIVLTGLPGCGKTTVAKRTAALLGRRAAGFFTEEVRSPRGERVGFRVESLDGRRGELARKGGGSGPRVGAYRVNLPEFEAVALPALREASPDRVLVIDEIGKMECHSEPFRRRVSELLEADLPLLATAPRHGGGTLLDKVRRRPDVEILSVTRENRDRLPQDLLMRFTR